MKFATLAAAATALALTAAPAAVSAQAAAPAAPAVDVTAGATVFGPQGGEVGTVLQVSDGVVIVDTGEHRAPLPANAFAQTENGLSITVTRAQPNTMRDQQVAAAHAQRDAALMAGAMVHTADDAMLGTVTSVEGDTIVVEREAGPIQLLREHFAVNPRGTLIALFTAAQTDAAAAGAAAQAQGSGGATAEAGQ